MRNALPSHLAGVLRCTARRVSALGCRLLVRAIHAVTLSVADPVQRNASVGVTSELVFLTGHFLTDSRWSRVLIRVVTAVIVPITKVALVDTPLISVALKFTLPTT